MFLHDVSLFIYFSSLSVKQVRYRETKGSRLDEKYETLLGRYCITFL